MFLITLLSTTFERNKIKPRKPQVFLSSKKILQSTYLIIISKVILL